MDELEKHIKREADKFRMTPSEKVWRGINSRFSEPQRNSRWGWAAVTLLFVLGLATWGWLSLDPSHGKYADSKVLTQDATTLKTYLSSGLKTQVSKSLNEIPNNPSQQAYSFSPKATKKQQPELIQISVPKENEITSVAMMNERHVVDPLPSAHLTLSGAGFTHKSSDLLSLNTSAVRNQHEHILVWMATCGFNLSRPSHTSYHNFIKPGLGYSMQFMVGYHLLPWMILSSGLGVQHDVHHIGAINIEPETMMVPLAGQSTNQTATYRLNNESQQKNKFTRLTIPVYLEVQLLKTHHLGSLSSFGGIEFTRATGTKYIIKNPTDDRLFSNASFLNRMNTFTTIGFGYKKPLSNHLSLVTRFKCEYANESTYKKGYALHENLWVAGFDLGILF